MGLSVCLYLLLPSLYSFVICIPILPKNDWISKHINIHSPEIRFTEGESMKFMMKWILSLKTKMRTFDKNDIITYGTLIIGRHFSEPAFENGTKLFCKWHQFNRWNKVVAVARRRCHCFIVQFTTLFHSCSILYYQNETHLKNLTGFVILAIMIMRLLVLLLLVVLTPLCARNPNKAPNIQHTKNRIF